MAQEREENPPTETRLLTLQEILVQYPPQETPFTRKVKNGGEDVLSSQVSKNENGQIVYVVPGSTHFTQGGSEPEAPENLE